MTVSDDLATLREELARFLVKRRGKYPQRDYLDALDRVEDEIARLKEERDGSVFLRSLADASAATWRNRAEAAEAEVKRLRRLVDEARPYMEKANSNAGPINDWLFRAFDGDEDGGDGRQPDGYRTEGGRVIPTDR